jgi:hypothetical protein
VVPSSLLEVFGSKKRMSVVLRPRTPGLRVRAAFLNFQELSALAHALHADARQTRHLILLGLLEHAPQELRTFVGHHINNSLQLANDLGRNPPPYKFTGPFPEIPNP